MQPYQPWDFCKSINCIVLMRTASLRKELLCKDCKAYQMHDYLQERGQILEENNPLLKALEIIRDVGVVVRYESWGAVRSKPTLASVKRFAGEVLARAKAGGSDG